MKPISLFPNFCDQLIEKLKPEIVDQLSLEMWEGRILPLLYELKNKNYFNDQPVKIFDAQIQFHSNSSQNFEYISRITPQTDLNLNTHLYLFSNLKDLSALRRFKDYPDETGRDELEYFWIGICPEAQSMIVINPPC